MKNGFGAIKNKLLIDLFYKDGFQKKKLFKMLLILWSIILMSMVGNGSPTRFSNFTTTLNRMIVFKLRLNI